MITNILFHLLILCLIGIHYSSYAFISNPIIRLSTKQTISLNTKKNVHTMKAHTLINWNVEEQLRSLPQETPILEVFSEILRASNYHSFSTFPNVTLYPQEPTICRYIIPNPLSCLRNPRFFEYHGLSIQDIRTWPVIYIANINKDYGTLGLMINQLAEVNVGNLYPAYRKLRNQPLFLGGKNRKGASLLMIHRKTGFPENRSWKTLTEFPSHQLFYSPDIAMANELCLTDDAIPEDFKFFQHSSIWHYGQLEREWGENHWITIDAPIDVFFQQKASDTLYLSLLQSLILSADHKDQTTSSIDSSTDSTSSLLTNEEKSMIDDIFD